MKDELLRDWTDALIRYQIADTGNPRLDGGILCPACMRVHGRSGDAVLPLCAQYAQTGQTHYLEAAQKLFSWSEHMVRPDGSYNNDTNSSWNGITVFAAIAQGETLLHFGKHLPAPFHAALLHRFTVSSHYLLQNIEQIGGNINYPTTCTYAMALAAKLLPDEQASFQAKAASLSHFALSHITADGLFYGEGHPIEAVTPRSCRPVDIGYNVEESLPSLAQYALLAELTELGELTGPTQLTRPTQLTGLTDDQPMMQAILQTAKTHLDFMLPDGGWDNSFGSRSYKWTYWGSRTSDGCLAGFGALANYDPIFAKAALLNLNLLQSCTHDGLLHGGPMYFAAHEPPCIHHTICHAKTLALTDEAALMEQAALLDEVAMIEKAAHLDEAAMMEKAALLDKAAVTGKAALLDEAAVTGKAAHLDDVNPLIDEENFPTHDTITQPPEGIHYYPTIDTAILRKGPWRATVSNYDYQYLDGGHLTGGAISLLWHPAWGTILFGGMDPYRQNEPNNMQMPAYQFDICPSPRFQLVSGGSEDVETSGSGSGAGSGSGSGAGAGASGGSGSSTWSGKSVDAGGSGGSTRSGKSVNAGISGGFVGTGGSGDAGVANVAGDRKNRSSYSSSNDLSARMTFGEESHSLWVKSSGQLRTPQQASGGGYSLQYSITSDTFSLTGKTEAKKAVFLLPIVSGDDDIVRWLDSTTVQIQRGSTILSVTADTPLAPDTQLTPPSAITVPDEYRNNDGTFRRLFSPVGGFQALVLCVKGGEMKVRLQVSAGQDS